MVPIGCCSLSFWHGVARPAAWDAAGGRIEKTGAIDVTAIRSAITRIMEGGEEAFKLRQKKYGF